MIGKYATCYGATRYRSYVMAYAVVRMLAKENKKNILHTIGPAQARSVLFQPRPGPGP